MAQFIIPAQEAIAVLRANVQMPPILHAIDVTANGPRLSLRIAPILPAINILMRLQRYSAPVAQFLLEGLPSGHNVGSMLQLPAGIHVQDNVLAVNTDTLIRQELGLRGLRVTSVGWDGAAYRIEAAPG